MVDYLLVAAMFTAGTLLAFGIRAMRMWRWGLSGVIFSLGANTLLLFAALAVVSLWFVEIRGLSMLKGNALTIEQKIEVYALPTLMVWTGMMLVGLVCAWVWRRRQTRPYRLVLVWIVRPDDHMRDL